LLRGVALAVQEAHRNLVIHRDIKPSNVLVTGDGVPKLLDFGIAKLLEDDGSNSDEADTRTGLRLLTPRYAAPEQRRAEPVSTATDVFQLGVLLVETMTGSRPDAESLAGTVPAGVPGDLARIAAMALREDPARRYATASALVDDLDRWLDGRPVTARPDRWTYRSGKFLQRHRWVAPAAALALVLGAGWLATTVQHGAELAQQRDAAQEEALRADAERDRAVLAQAQADAERNTAVAALARADSLQQMAVVARRAAEAERDRAEVALARTRLEILRTEQVTRFLTGLFQGSNISQEPRADTLSARTLLTRGTARVRTELADQPELLATILGTTGAISLTLGLDEAEELWADAVTLQRQLYGPDDPRVALALLHQARQHLGLRGFAAATPKLAEAIRIWRATPGASTDTLASMLYNNSVALHELGQLAEAERTLRDVLAIYESQGRRTTPQYLSTQSRLALMIQRQNRPREALELYREVLAAQRLSSEISPLSLGATLNNMASLLRSLGQSDEAITFYREAYEIQLTHAAGTDRNTNVAGGNLAGALARLGRHDEAADILAGEIARHRELFPPDHARLGAVLGHLAVHFENIDRHVEAEPLRREQLRIYEAALGNNHVTVQSRVRLGQLLATLSRPEEAEAHLLAADSLVASLSDPEFSAGTQALVRAALVRLYENLGRAEDAARYRSGQPDG
ncbi:MAG: tetratricopeptide repeat protein, partial [Gemmatimonadales bacterium]